MHFLPVSNFRYLNADLDDRAVQGSSLKPLDC